MSESKKLDIAPHEGCELEYVMLGIKPLASLEKSKQPEQFDLALKLHYAVSVMRHTEDLITVTRKENANLHNIFALLTSSKATIVVRSKAEKHRLLGRLFGYTEEQIEDFIKADMQCACGQCKWDEHEETK